MVRVIPLPGLGLPPTIAIGVLLGLALGLGLWMLVSLLPRMSRPRLTARIAPYVADVSPAARELLRRRPAEPGLLLGALASPVAMRVRGLLAGILGGEDATARRLRQAGSTTTVERFRSRQLLGLLVGAVLGAGVAFVLARGGQPVLVQAAAVAIGAALGVVLPDRLLLASARSRLRRIAAELPTVLEFLALSLSAGESLADACRRVARTGHGELARELAAAVAESNAGIPLSTALSRMADGVALPALSRCVDQLVTALDRGAPLVEVLRAQAQDARESAGRDLLEAAGRKEVAMLVPRCCVSAVPVRDGHRSGLTRLLVSARCRGPPSPQGHPGKDHNMATKDAFATFRSEAAEAVKFHDKNWTNTAITKERAKRLAAARQRLADTLPLRDAEGPDDPRPGVLETLRPTTGDQVAVAGNEWAKVKARLDAGANLANLIDGADRMRLAAIADHAEQDLAAGSDDPEGALAEVRARVFQRLVSLGDEGAVAASEALTKAEHEAAWTNLAREATIGPLSVGARSALYRASQEDYDEALPDTHEASALDAAIAHLDRVVPEGAEVV